ncbi:MAG TPA: hypothetical protein VE465_08645 [Streptosporangiaceae bacterium]|nr:hypothetical protein [Streptosporangiaceae bacterium]
MEYKFWQDLFAEGVSDENIRTEIGKLRGVEPAVLEVAVRRRVYEFLAAQETMHIVVEDALNFGHQASAATLAESLAELGYSKEFTFVAPANILEKITRILPGGLRDRVTVREVAEFNPDQDYPKPLVPGPCGLVMAGADDRLDGESSTSLRFLDYFGATNAIILKPYAWSASVRRLYRRDREPAELQQLPAGAVYHYHVKRPNEPISGDLSANLAALLTAGQSGTVVLVPMYGLHRLEDPERASVYANAVGAIRAAYQDRPTVLLEIGTTRVAYAPQPPDITSVDLNADTLQEKLRNLGPGSVLAVTVPSVDQDVFREIYRIGDGVRFLEGANTSNYVQLLGLPYLSPRTEDTPYPDVGDDVNGVLDNATKALSGRTEWSNELAENDIYKNKLYRTYTALNAVNGDLRIPRPGNAPTLNAETVERLRAVADLDLENEVGPEAQEAIQQTKAYNAKILKGYEGGPPDALVLDAHKVQNLRTALTGLIATYGAEIAALLKGYSHTPGGNAVNDVANALRSAATNGDPVRQYFQRVAMQAADYKYDQVLQALDLFCTDQIK